MTNYYQIDFLEAGENKSGDAICLRYGNTITNSEIIHVVDGGYSDDGKKILEHINTHFDKGSIDHVVLTHPDGDHAAGLKHILESATVGRLWMNRPWTYVDDLLPLFDYSYTRDGLIQRLKKDYPLVADLEEIALQKGIPISEALQGSQIGEFRVLSPSKNRFVELIVASDKTPSAERKARLLGEAYKKIVEVINFVKSIWGDENLKGDTDGTSRENEMSVVQFFNPLDKRIILTGDTGVEGLEESYDFFTNTLNESLPGVSHIQVPHHGGRRNVSTEILDKWLGEKLPEKPINSDDFKFTAIVSANKNDPDHPKKNVVRAFWHRGGKLSSTEGMDWVGWHQGRQRLNSSNAPIIAYPEDSEE